MFMYKKPTILIIFFLVLFTAGGLHAEEQNYPPQKKVLGITFIIGFNKALLKTEKLKPVYIQEKRVRPTIKLSNDDIYELHITKNKKEEKPFGLQLAETMFLKPRVSTSYLRGMMEHLNSNAGLYSADMQSNIDSRIGENNENAAEGGIELIYFF